MMDWTEALRSSASDDKRISAFARFLNECIPASSCQMATEGPELNHLLPFELVEMPTNECQSRVGEGLRNSLRPHLSGDQRDAVINIGKGVS